MNKNVSLAIEKAVSSLSSKNINKIKDNTPKKPDLFSLSGETELFQNDKGITIKIDRSRDANLTNFGRATLDDRYLGQNESYQDLFARVASTYADDNLHAQRIYNYISNLWFMPATPVLSNGGTERGLPISCFLNEASDSLKGITDLWEENVWLAARGGGIGSYWGNLRSIGEKIGKVGKTSGIIPFIKVMDSLTLAISQGSLRRGSAACYLQIDHPEIEEFIEMRRPTGGDVNRRSLNLHHGVLVSDAFMRAVETDDQWALRSPYDGSVQSTISARNLWIRLLTARVETGEPYIIYIDTVNRQIPQHHKLAGLTVKTSNLCSEITLPTGIDNHGNDRTAVCCLSSLNLDTYDEWKDNTQFVEDVMRFLDNVMTDFINRAPDEFADAKYSAMRERSVGLGVMGLHSYFQQKNIPFGSVMSKVWNKKIFKNIQEKVDAASVTLAEERGSCPDAEDYGIKERFSNKTAIAPTASISIICGGSSPGIEPIAANSFTHKTLSGSFNVRNKYLKKVLQKYNKDTDEIWSSITTNQGSVSHLDFLTPEDKDTSNNSKEANMRKALRIFAAAPTAVAAYFRIRKGKKIIRPDKKLSFSENFLKMMLGKVPDKEIVKAFDVSMILYAEHSFNVSTFTARTITSSLSDMHGAITGAIASLKGPLHGGANEAVMYMFKEIGKPKKAKAWIEDAIEKKKVIMGFGHRVYRSGDSRVPTMQSYMYKVAKIMKRDDIVEIYDTLAKVMLEKKNIHPNVDYPCGPTYHMIGIDTDFFTPIFVMARITGWSAHIMEQHTANKLIRPLSKYSGSDHREVVLLNQR